MKKWILGFVLLAMVTGEMSCVVRTREERRHRRHDRKVIIVK